MIVSRRDFGLVAGVGSAFIAFASKAAVLGEGSKAFVLFEREIAAAERMAQPVLDRGAKAIAVGRDPGEAMLRLQELAELQPSGLIVNGFTRRVTRDIVFRSFRKAATESSTRCVVGDACQPLDAWTLRIDADSGRSHPQDI